MRRHPLRKPLFGNKYNTAIYLRRSKTPANKNTHQEEFPKYIKLQWNTNSQKDPVVQQLTLVFASSEESPVHNQQAARPVSMYRTEP